MKRVWRRWRLAYLEWSLTWGAKDAQLMTWALVELKAGRIGVEQFREVALRAHGFRR